MVTKIDNNDWYYDYEEESSVGDYVFIVGALLHEGAQNIYVFLSTHPIPVGVRNTVGVILGEGGTIGLTHPMKALRDLKNDILKITGW